MNLMDGEHDSELLQAQAHVWNHILNFINSMTLKCAIELGIPDIINKHGKPMTLDELVNALPIHQSKSQFVHRLMRILIHSGFFAQQKLSQINDHDEQGYVLTNASQLLLQDNPFSAAPILQVALDPILISPWQQLSTWFQNDDPTTVFYTTHGMKFWEYAGQEPRINHLFNEAMASDARLATSVLIHKCRDVFQGLNSLVDIGGGTGIVVKAIAESFPHLECTCFDLPHVVAGLKSDIQTLKYVAGNMFEAVPLADAFLLKWILHDWNDEECIKILKKCKEAIIASNNEKKAKVIIIDMIREDKKGEETETQLFFDMLMMVLFTGRERDEKEWAKIFIDAGFNDYKITPVLGLRSLIELYP